MGDHQTDDWGLDHGDFGELGDLAEAPVPEKAPSPPKEETSKSTVPPQRAPLPPPRENAWTSGKTSDVRSALRSGSVDRRDDRQNGGFRRMVSGNDRWGGGQGDGGSARRGDAGFRKMSSAPARATGGGTGSGAGRSGGECTVFVGNIAPIVDERFLKEIVFRDCNVRDVRFPKSSTNSENRVAFVEMRDQESFDKALAKDGFVLEGRSLRVNPEKRRDRDNSASSSGYGGRNSGRGREGGFGAVSYGGSFGSKDRNRGPLDYGTNPRGDSQGRYAQPSDSFQGAGWQKRTTISSPATPAERKTTGEGENTPASSTRPRLKLKPRTKPLPKQETPKTPADGAAYLTPSSQSRTSPVTPSTPTEAPGSSTQKPGSAVRKPLQLKSGRTTRETPKNETSSGNGGSGNNTTTAAQEYAATERNTKPNPEGFIAAKSRGSNSRLASTPTKDEETKSTVEFTNSFAALNIDINDE